MEILVPNDVRIACDSSDIEIEIHRVHSRSRRARFPRLCVIMAKQWESTRRSEERSAAHLPIHLHVRTFLSPAPPFALRRLFFPFFIFSFALLISFSRAREITRLCVACQVPSFLPLSLRFFSKHSALSCRLSSHGSDTRSRSRSRRRTTRTPYELHVHTKLVHT